MLDEIVVIKMIIKFVSLIVFFMAHYDFKPTNSNNMLIPFNAQSHIDIDIDIDIKNSKSSKSEARRLFDASGRKLISTFERNQINKGCKCSREGKCEPKGCKLRRASSRSIAGKFRELITYFRRNLYYIILYYIILYYIILYYITEDIRKDCESYLDCGEHGSCKTESGTPKCVCDSGWIGDDCSIGI